MCLTSPTWTKSLTIKILQILNVLRTLIASKRRIEQINFFDWLSNVKTLVLSNGSDFFPKTQKSSSGWGLCPQTLIATGGWRLRLQTPVYDTFGYNKLLNTPTKLDICNF